MNWQEAARILELSNPRTLDEVREAYSIQVKAWHPDRFEGDAKMQRIGTAKMKLINEAFKFVKDNWSHRASLHATYEFPRATEPIRQKKAVHRDLITVLENGSVLAKKTNLTVGAKRIHEYLGDAVIAVTVPDHRSRELRLKVGEAATVEFGKMARFEVKLVQVHQMYKLRRGIPSPFFDRAADLVVTRLA